MRPQPSRKLLQKAQVATLQPADIVDRVAHHHEARQAQPEGEAVPFVRIDAAAPEHVWVDEAAGKQLDPSALLAHRAPGPAADQAADIQLEAWLDKWEEAGAQPDGDLAMEDRRQQRLHEVNEIADQDIAIDHHSLELVKRVLVRGVDAFIAEDAARGDHPKRGTELFHAADLDRRSVGAEKVATCQPESVLHIARGVVRRNVQRVKVVVFGLDFGSVEDGKAERAKEVLDFPLDLSDGMKRARLDSRRRDGKVKPLGIKLL